MTIHSDRDGSDQPTFLGVPLAEGIADAYRTPGPFLGKTPDPLRGYKVAGLLPADQAPAGPPLHEQADRDGDNVPSDRERAYVRALSRPFVGAEPLVEQMARAVVAVADREQAALRAEVERLRRWKAEATEVTIGLQDLGKALGLHLGERITGPSATEAAKRLSARAEKAEATIARVEALLIAQQERHTIEDGQCQWCDAPEDECDNRLALAALRGPETTEEAP